MSLSKRPNDLPSKISAALFNTVLEAYVLAKVADPLSAMCYDPDEHPRKWTPRTAEFIADFELATKSALRNSPELHDVLDRMVLRAAHELGADMDPSETEVPIPIAAAAAVVQRCSRVYFKRRLTPAIYFRVIRQRREESK
jgi:hypothetical protein